MLGLLNLQSWTSDCILGLLNSLNIRYSSLLKPSPMAETVMAFCSGNWFLVFQRTFTPVITSDFDIILDSVRRGGNRCKMSAITAAECGLWKQSGCIDIQSDPFVKVFLRLNKFSHFFNITCSVLTDHWAEGSQVSPEMGSCQSGNQFVSDVSYVPTMCLAPKDDVTE